MHPETMALPQPRVVAVDLPGGAHGFGLVSLLTRARSLGGSRAAFHKHLYWDQNTADAACRGLPGAGQTGLLARQLR